MIPLSELERELEGGVEGGGGGGGLVSGTLAISILTAAMTGTCTDIYFILLAAWLTLFLMLVGNPSSLLVL